MLESIGISRLEVLLWETIGETVLVIPGYLGTEVIDIANIQKKNGS